MISQSTFLAHLAWVEQHYCAACKWVEEGDAQKNRELVKLWLTWGFQEGFLHTFSPGIILFARPIARTDLERFRQEYFETLFEADRTGDTLLVDFCYAPGHVPFILGLLKHSGRPYVAWEHARTGKIHFTKANRLKTMSASTSSKSKPGKT